MGYYLAVMSLGALAWRPAIPDRLGAKIGCPLMSVELQ